LLIGRESGLISVLNSSMESDALTAGIFDAIGFEGVLATGGRESKS
jgi:hypothetical protein